MREIQKKQEPRLLTEYRSNGGEYDGPNFTPVKEAIKQSLLQEQGHLCAYCMARITSDNMKVEHWACQSLYPSLQLDYSNLLGCCMGAEGSKYVDQTCDSRKGNQLIKFNPSKPQDRINSLIKYDGQGTIISIDDEFSIAINKVLNLNKARLIENRLSILNSIRKVLSNRPGKRRKTEIKQLLKEYMTANTQNKLKEYCGLVYYYLSSKL